MVFLRGIQYYGLEIEVYGYSSKRRYERVGAMFSRLIVGHLPDRSYMEGCPLSKPEV